MKTREFIVLIVSATAAVITFFMTRNFLFPILCGFIAGEAMLNFKIESWKRK
jgi:hypothetical protein